MIMLISLVLVCASAALVSGVMVFGPFKLNEGSTAHGLRSDNVELVDTKTIRIPNIHYDGTGPDTFWIVGTGGKSLPLERPASAPGLKIPNEKGTCDVLKAYTGETIQLVLPAPLTVNDVDWLAMYCFTNKHTFGWVDFATVRNDLPGKRFSPALVPEADSALPLPKPCENYNPNGAATVGPRLLIVGFLPVMLKMAATYVTA